MIFLVCITKNLVFHESIKHIKIDYHFAQTKLQESFIHLSLVSSSNQVIDMLTKHPYHWLFHDNLSKLNMKDMHVSTCGTILNDRSYIIL